VSAILFGGRALRSRFFSSAILSTTQESQTAYIENISELNRLIGSTARAITVLKPSGTVQIDKETYEAVADGVFVDEGTMVSVIGVRGNYLVVRK